MDSLVLKPLPGWLAVRTILESIALAFSNTAFGHHLSKSNIENWFALELAFHLDPALEHHEWTALVEERRMDLLLIPRAVARAGERLALGIGSAPSIAVEIRESRLARGDVYLERSERLAQDLTKLGPAPLRLGVLIGTDAVWQGGTPGRRRSQPPHQGDAELCKGLRRVARLERQIAYRDFAGKLWFDVVVADALRDVFVTGPDVTYPDIGSFAMRAERALPVTESLEDQARLAASARTYYDQYGELPRAHTAIQRCLCFEHRRLRDVGREPTGADAEYQLKLYRALTG